MASRDRVPAGGGVDAALVDSALVADAAVGIPDGFFTDVSTAACASFSAGAGGGAEVWFLTVFFKVGSLGNSAVRVGNRVFATGTVALGLRASCSGIWAAACWATIEANLVRVDFAAVTTVAVFGTCLLAALVAPMAVAIAPGLTAGNALLITRAFWEEAKGVLKGAVFATVTDAFGFAKGLPFAGALIGVFLTNVEATVLLAAVLLAAVLLAAVLL
ncbi:MAG: hypothetical protein SGI86_22020, partial [Deltaproteobacteria bacterium]|nr:hypothetical protein [Deltaproteobacteria bacterium]